MSDEPPALDWSNLDEDVQRAGEYLDTTSGLEAIQAYKRRSHRLLELSPSDRVVDIGCGAGVDLGLLGETLGPDASIIGIDRSAPLIDQARQQSEGRPNVSLHMGDALELPFADSTMDASRADRLLQHLEAPVRALKEMKRITKPGGRIGISEPNWATVQIVAPEVDQSITRQVTKPELGSARHPRIGSRLYSIMGSSGLTDRVVDSVTVVFTELDTANDVLSLVERLETLERANELTAKQAQNWNEALENADSSGRFFASITGFTVVGQVLDE